MSNAVTWEDGCLDASDKVYAAHSFAAHSFARLDAEGAIFMLRDELDRFTIDGAAYTELDYAAMAAVAANHAAEVNCDDDRWSCLDRIEKLLAAKQHDYGHGNILKFGLLGIVVRISDKLARLENLYARGSDDDDQAYNESIGDTWDDIVGYCIIAIMVLDGTFELPLAADVEVDDPTVEDVSPLPGGATTCIDEIGNVYHRRDDGSWEYIGTNGSLVYEDPPAPHFGWFNQGFSLSQYPFDWTWTPKGDVTTANTGRVS